MRVKVIKKSPLNSSIITFSGNLGGPIQYKIGDWNHDIFYVVGVMSSDDFCGSDLPNIYTRVRLIVQSIIEL